MPTVAHVLYCSFCEKSQREVAQLVTGSGKICICNECADLAYVIVHQHYNDALWAAGDAAAWFDPMHPMNSREDAESADDAGR